MPTRRITLEADVQSLFGKLMDRGGDPSQLGERIAEALLAPPGEATIAGLAAYGVSIVNEPAPTGDDPHPVHLTASPA